MTFSPPVVRTPMPVQKDEDAHVLLARLEASMEGLIELIESETKLVKAGKLFAAAELEAKKTEYARAYVELMENTREQESTIRSLIPDKLEKLARRHEEFKALLQINMAALSTARDVTRNLIQGVAESVGQGQRPNTYGAAGHLENKNPISAQGIAVDRAL